MKVITFVKLFVAKVERIQLRALFGGVRGGFSHDSNAMFGKKSNSLGVRGGFGAKNIIATFLQKSTV